MLLVLATPDWGGDYMKSTVALTRELASTYRVLYVTHPPTYLSIVREQLTTDGVGATLRAMRRRTAHLQEVETGDSAESIHVLTPPPVWPLNRLPPFLYDRVLTHNAQVIRRVVRTWMDKLSMTSPVVLNALNPHYGVALAGDFDEQSRVYYCFDEVRARDWNGIHGGRMENRYVSMVDAVVGSSPALYERLAEQHDNAYFVPNGVDFSLFNRAANGGRQETDRSPCIGYVGTVGGRLDQSLLTSLIEGHPCWEFRFVGRITDPAIREQLEQYEWVTLTGPKPPEALPEEMRRMDVGLIPFVRNAFTRCIYPLKVNEYLAAGLPVVSTAFADLSDFRGLIHIAKTKRQFIAAVEQVVRRPVDPTRKHRRIEVAASNRWANRASEMQAVLDQTRTSTTFSASHSR